MSPEEFNDAYPVGTTVTYWPGIRHGAGRESATRTPAWNVGDTACVSVVGYGGGIALTHIEVREAAGGSGMTTTTTTPTAEQLAQTVLIGAFDDILDYWETTNGCVAWVGKSDRRCGRSSPGYLCTRHETVARRRWEKQQVKA